MRLARLSIVAAVLALAFAPVAPAVAKTYPRVAGMSCAAAAKKVGSANVWRTSFRGAQQTLFGDDDIWGPYRWYHASPCFTSQASCKAWLYNTQTDWPFNMDFVPCHRGVK